MKLIINKRAALGSSLGVKRFFSGVMKYLAWPSGVEMTGEPRFKSLARASEFLQMGRPSAIYWSPTHRGPLWAHHHVVSVHDCINIEYTYRGDWRLPVFRRLFNGVLRNAESIVALSHATRVSILNHYDVDEAKITVIPAGFDLPTEPVAEIPPQMHSPFVLMVTNTLPHKNSGRGCEAFIKSTAARQGVGLTVVGSLDADALRCLHYAGVSVNVYNHIDDAALMALYRQCLFLFSPTLAEGYNLPIAEALSAGSNVLCSDIPAHREFYAGHAVFFDQSKLDSMTESLNTALARTGRWAPQVDRSQQRSFRDMAADYRGLFQTIANKYNIDVSGELRENL